MTDFSDRRIFHENRGKALSYREMGKDLNPGPWMFTEDITLGIVPYRLRGEYDVEVIWHGDQSEQNKAIHVLQSLARDEGGHQDEAVLDAVRKLAQEIAWSGRGCFEIQRHESTFDLLRFTPNRLLKCGGFIVQFVPIKLWKEIGRRINIMDAKDIWIVSMPTALGGRGGYRKSLRSLTRIGRSLMPQFYNDDLTQGRQTILDFNEYRRSVEIYEAKVTGLWGWNRRDFSGKNWTEYALFDRIMRFRFAQATLREHIIREINSLFIRLDIKCSLTLFGLPSANFIAAEHYRMRQGEISFARASDMTRGSTG